MKKIKKKKRSIFKNNIHLYIPPFMWAGFIYFLSSLTFSSQGGIPGLDKVVHFAEYFILTLLFYRMYFSELGLKKFTVGYLAVITSFIFSLTDEFHQTFVPTREVSLYDILFDTIGASAAIFAIWKLLPKAPKKLLTWAKKLGLI
ncbi:VanZ family protein [Candidatus Woesebacteria bacterium]|nr:VanZ family protein [Candidatus Woesebacteria bacterium]